MKPHNYFYEAREWKAEWKLHMETAQSQCVIRCYCWQDALFSRSPSAQKKGIYDMGKLETKSFEISSPQEVVK